MKPKEHAKSIFIPVLIACLLPALGAGAASNAQTRNQSQGQGRVQGEDHNPLAVKGENPPTAAELITDYLRQDIFLRPGVGLKKVKIGSTFDHVLKVWGHPAKKGGGIASNQWTYRADSNTVITLSGDSKVRNIDVAGGISSPYSTTEGASFGMAQYQLATIYGSAPEKSNTVTYDHRGISFVLDHGQVSQIEIFAPR